ncbi:alpha/beta hydrolase [Motiliproteus sp.]|uniref:alpha/beta hydrolase n=1 Tax=Motiliproteus sp. TaxID=1898955 RepID=UPI003BAA9424
MFKIPKPTGSAVSSEPHECQQWQHQFEQLFEPWQQDLNGRLLSGYRSRHRDSARTEICWLHGNGFNSLAYTPILSSLLQAQDSIPGGLSIYTTDLPGHGRSQTTGKPWPVWREMARCAEKGMLQQLVQEPGLQRIGIGHSLGGVVSLLQAHQYPERFDRLLLLDPVLFTPGIVAAQQVLKALGLWRWMPMPKVTRRRESGWQSVSLMHQQLAQKGFYRSWDPQALAGFVAGGHQVVAQGAAQRVELSCPPEWEARIFSSVPQRLTQAIREVRIPVHVLCARNSFPFILKGTRRAAQINPHITYQIWGEGHCFPMEQPHQTAALIKEWLASTA